LAIQKKRIYIPTTKKDPFYKIAKMHVKIRWGKEVQTFNEVNR